MFKDIAVVGVNPTEEEFGLTSQIKGDYRSMRKLSSDAELYLQLQNTAVEGTAISVKVSGLVRLLFKLP